MSPSVTITRGVMGGQPCLAGTRIDIESVVSMARDGSIDAVAAMWDEVSREDVIHAIWAWYQHIAPEHGNTKIMRWTAEYRRMGAAAGDPPIRRKP